MLVLLFQPSELIKSILEMQQRTTEITERHKNFFFLKNVGLRKEEEINDLESFRNRERQKEEDK